MKIGVIGNYDNPYSERIKFCSKTTFFDFDIIIIDFSTILDEYNNYSMLSYDVKRRKQEIEEVLELGRSIIIVNPYNTKCSVSYSSGGLTINEDIDLLCVLPMNIEVVRSEGSNIKQIEENDAFSTFWGKNKYRLVYNVYYSNPIGYSAFAIKNTDKIVGLWLKINDGIIAFLPTVDRSREDFEDIYFNSLPQLISSLRNEINKRTRHISIPDWCNDYQLPTEQQTSDSIDQYEKEIEEISKEIEKQKSVIGKLEEYKILFAGTGKPLEKQVAKVFIELGFTVHEDETKRDDLIIEYGDKVAVVEIKGVRKSAAEKHATQLEKWVSEYYIAHSSMPKGILIVNAYKDTPLGERTDDAFPAQMMSYCSNREHCLISGIQLLGLYFYVTDNPDKKDEAIDKLFATIGVFDGFDNWEDFIDIIEVTDAPSSDQ